MPLRFTRRGMHQKIRIIASLAFLAASPIEARSAPANTLPDLWREWEVLRVAGPTVNPPSIFELPKPQLV